MRTLAVSLALAILASTGPVEVHAQEKNQPAASDKRGTPEAPLVIKADADQSRREAAERKQDRIERQNTDSAIIGYTRGLFIATGILAVFTFLLWFATRRLVVGADEVAQRELRAYLGMSFRWVAPGNDWPQGLDTGTGYHETGVFVRNHGHTPARNVQFKGTCRILPLKLSPNAIQTAIDQITETAHGHLGGKVCDPGEALPLYFRLRSKEPVRRASQSECVYAFGKLTYEDVFGRSRFATVCAYWKDDWQEWLSGPQYNEFGTDPLPHSPWYRRTLNRMLPDRRSL